MFQADIALAEVEAGDAHVLGARRCGVDDHHIAVARRVLLDDDGIAAFRQHAAGEDARGLARLECRGQRPAGRHLADELQACGRRGDVLAAHRVAVHGGDIVRRLGAACGEILGEHAAFRLGERHALDRQRLGSFEHARECIRDRE